MILEILEHKYLYASLLLFSIAYPMAQTFEKRLTYYKKFKYLIQGTFLMMLIFIPWDIYFTAQKIWWFNDSYILGIKIMYLPIEEWLFFIFVPFSSFFIFEVLRYFLKKDILFSIANYFYFALALTLLITAFIFHKQQYTFVTFILCSATLLFTVYKNPIWKGYFLLSFLIVCLPFLLVNGVLTGGFTHHPVVNYNPDEILGIRIFTIPIEDSMYNLLMMLLVMHLGYSKNLDPMK